MRTQLLVEVTGTLAQLLADEVADEFFIVGCMYYVARLNGEMLGWLPLSYFAQRRPTALHGASWGWRVVGRIH